MIRFFRYHVDFIKKYEIDLTSVILTNTPPKAREHKSRSANFTPGVIVLSERNADEALIKIKEKIRNGEDVNKLELLYLPMYISPKGRDMCDLLEEAISLTPAVSAIKEEREHIQSLMLLLMGRFVGTEKFRKV